MYLLDTNVLSELRRAKSGSANTSVVNWAKSVPAISLYISAISVLELETGVLLAERRDKTQGEMLRCWLNEQVLPEFSKRTLAVDLAVAVRCAKLHVPDPKSDRDSLIAATALVHDKTVVTRNTKDFEATGVKLLNPWN